MKTALCLVATLSIVGTNLSAQDVCQERLMIPIVAHGVPGINGSVWDSRLAITNHATEPVAIDGYGQCALNPCASPPPVVGMSIIYPEVYTNYLYVDCDRTQDLTVQLRVQDVSRQAETWGTAIPVVGTNELFDGRVMSIVDVPNTPEFRSMLRVYGFDGEQQSNVSIRIYELDDQVTEGGHADRLLVDLQRVVPTSSAPQLYPAKLEVPLWPLSELASSARLRLEIRGDAGHRLWSFVSATNNNTQHVTVIVPR